ncbi:MAG: hypothetical protein ACXVC1_06535, partial [Tumebacillaceae bacterium]
RVYLYEPSYFGGLSYFVTGGYNIMQEGQEYIVFLKHLKVPSGYHYKDDEDISFMPVSSLYGKYPLQSKRNTHVVSENTEDSYYQVKDFDILTQEESTLKKYEEFKRLVMQQMK